MSAIQFEYPSSTGNVQDVIRYLYRLVEQLNVALNSIDEDNMNDEYRKTVKEFAQVSDKAKQLAEMLGNGELAKTTSVKNMYDTLRSSIVASANSVTASFNSLITQVQNEIKSYVEANYIASDPDMTLEEKISSMIQQTADQIRMEFSTIATLDTEALTDLALNFKTYFRYSANGLEIGKIGDSASQIVTRITNERIEWVIAGTDVVLLYIDAADNKLHINKAEIDTLSLGNEVSGYIDFDMEANGLFLKWRS